MRDDELLPIHIARQSNTPITALVAELVDGFSQPKDGCPALLETAGSDYLFTSSMITHARVWKSRRPQVTNNRDVKKLQA